MFNSDLPVKRCERDSQLLLVFLMQYVKVCKTGRSIVTSLKLSMSFFSSLASLVEILNEEKSSLLKLEE